MFINPVMTSSLLWTDTEMWQSSTGQWYINPVLTSSLLWTDTEMWQS
jgi:hypothetical protein